MSIIETDNGAPLKFNVDYGRPLEEVHRDFMAEIQRVNGIEDVALDKELFSDLLVADKLHGNQ